MSSNFTRVRCFKLSACHPPAPIFDRHITMILILSLYDDMLNGWFIFKQQTLELICASLHASAAHYGSMATQSVLVRRFHSLGLTARTIACKINLHGESHCPQVNILGKPGVQLCERQDKSGNGKLVNFDQSWVDVKFNVCNMDGKTV